MQLDLTDDYDFRSAFEVANRDGINVCHGATCDNSPFSVEDVELTVAYSEGENDGADWLWVGLLTDGRWAFVAAGCDYTGWG